MFEKCKTRAALTLAIAAGAAVAAPSAGARDGSTTRPPPRGCREPRDAPAPRTATRIVEVRTRRLRLGRCRARRRRDAVAARRRRGRGRRHAAQPPHRQLESVRGAPRAGSPSIVSTNRIAAVVLSSRQSSSARSKPSASSSGVREPLGLQLEKCARCAAEQRLGVGARRGEEQQLEHQQRARVAHVVDRLAPASAASARSPVGRRLEDRALRAGAARHRARRAHEARAGRASRARGRRAAGASPRPARPRRPGAMRARDREPVRRALGEQREHRPLAGWSSSRARHRSNANARMARLALSLAPVVRYWTTVAGDQHEARAAACAERRWSWRLPYRASSRPTASSAPPHKLLIDGEWVEAASGKTFATLNPATEETLAEVAHGEARGHRPRGRAPRAGRSTTTRRGGG